MISRVNNPPLVEGHHTLNPVENSKHRSALLDSLDLGDRYSSKKPVNPLTQALRKHFPKPPPKESTEQNGAQSTLSERTKSISSSSIGLPAKTSASAFLSAFFNEEENHWLYVLAQAISIVAIYALNQCVPGINLATNVALEGIAALCSQVALKKIFGNCSFLKLLSDLPTPTTFLKSFAAYPRKPLHAIIQEKNYKLFAYVQVCYAIVCYAIAAFLKPEISLFGSLARMGITALSSHVALRLYFDSRPLKEAWRRLISP